MASVKVARPSARERLLASANELFYAEGVHAVGIDRVIEHAGVAKASLYSCFGSKDELIRAYLEGRHTAIRDRLTRELAVRYTTARERLLGVFEVQGETFRQPGYRGCAFVGASAESPPDSAVSAAATGYRGWLRSLFLDLAAEAGAADPAGLARQLALIYDGAGVTAWLDHDPGAAVAATSIAATLIEAAVPAGPGNVPVS
ncbi:MAG: TetR/AcrR family transcriptional regulator [Actinomycetota bacterium]